MEVEAVVCACRNLAVVWHIRRDGIPVAGVLEDGAGGVSLFGVPATFMRLLRASTKRRVILMIEVMAMAPAPGEKEPGGC